MKLVNNIKNFLFDKDYLICIYENTCFLFGYLEILKFDECNMVFKFDSFKLKIKGENLLVKKMLDKEILITGIIKSIETDYEKKYMG